MSDFTAGRLPPHSREAEYAVLGAVLRDNTAFDDVARVLDADDFYYDCCCRAWAVFADLIRAGRPVDLVTAHEALEAGGHLPDVGGVPFLAHLWESVPTAANAEHHARIVAEKASRRRLIHACTVAIRDSLDEVQPAPDQLAETERAILAIGDRGRKAEPVRLDAALAEALQRVDARARGEPDARIVPTGFPSLDRVIGGFRPGTLTILAARPSVGKTALLGGFTLAAAADGTPVLILSLEMAAGEIAERVLANRASVPLHRIVNGTIGPADAGELLDKGRSTADAAVWVDDDPHQTPGSIAATVRRMVRRKGIGVVLIDYLQLVRHDKAERHDLRVGETSKALKRLARQCGVPIVLLCQLNREVENRPDKKPRLSDLRDSGEIEQDADTVLMLHPEEFVTGCPRQRVNVLVAKQRNGPRKDVTLDYHRSFIRFEEPVPV